MSSDNQKPIPFQDWRKRETFFQQVRQARRRLLMLDYDGTLSGLTPDRDHAYPYAGVRERIQHLTQLPTTRMVIITGRAVAKVSLLLGVDPLPEVWGTHGWERLTTDGTYALAEIPLQIQQRLVREQAAIRDTGLAAHYELKPAGVALHWRGQPPSVITEIQTFVHTRWATLSIDAGLELHPFDGGMELRVSGQTKGSAVQQLLQEVQPDAAAFLGDDKTDEQAFEALAGHGLCVHVRPEPQKSTQATVWLRPPEELLAFLDAWIEASER